MPQIFRIYKSEEYGKITRKTLAGGEGIHSADEGADERFGGALEKTINETKNNHANF